MLYRSSLKRAFCLLLLYPFCITMTAAGGSAELQGESSGKPDSPAGDWRGMSICQVKPSGCHDEDSLYHVRPTETTPGKFELQADKIVDGEPVTMGTGPCSYDAAKSELSCPIAQNGALMRFRLHGDEMLGTMTLADGTTWRKITLKRVRGA